MVASTSSNASVELARAIASMHTILRTGPVIASGLDDQRYALGDWRSGPPRRWSGHAALAMRNADQQSVHGCCAAPHEIVGGAGLLATLATRFEPRVPGER
jgi:hypothetical protein